MRGRGGKRAREKGEGRRIELAHVLFLLQKETRGKKKGKKGKRCRTHARDRNRAREHLIFF
jgi:hypothetical protein